MFALVSPAAAPGAPDTPPRAGAPAPPPFPSTHSPGDRETTVGAVQLPRVDPRLAGAGTPDRAVLEWLHAWHRRQLARMTTWRDEHWATIMRSGDRDRLAARFRTNRLLGWLELPLRRAPTQATYLVEIEFRTLLDPVVRRVS